MDDTNIIPFVASEAAKVLRDNFADIVGTSDDWLDYESDTFAISFDLSAEQHIMLYIHVLDDPEDAVMPVIAKLCELFECRAFDTTSAEFLDIKDLQAAETKYTGGESGMAQTESCNCAAVDDEKIDTWQKFKKAKEYFEAQVKQGIFEEEKVAEPYYTWEANLWKGEWGSTKWYATKWYKCRVCGCLWEFEYPDFPSCGFIRKFEDGKYVPRGY